MSSSTSLQRNSMRSCYESTILVCLTKDESAYTSFLQLTTLFL